MCYLVSGVNPPRLEANRARLHSIFDTEADAKIEAEKRVRDGFTEVAIWKQIATPSIETSIKWSDDNASETVD